MTPATTTTPSPPTPPTTAIAPAPNAPPLFNKPLPPKSLSRWHGVTNSTTVGGDVHTVNIATATVNHAAHHRNIGGDGASGA